MCRVITMEINGRTIKVAEIKKKYIKNIVDAAQKCDCIDRIVLFGSSIQERCTEGSDIDIAVFGNQVPSRALASTKYERFARQLYDFDDHAQAYDILYFKTGGRNNSPILHDINEGEILYDRRRICQSSDTGPDRS